MSWFEVADGRLRFCGRITREPIAGWATSEEGAAAVAAAARETRFSLLGRTRKARRRLCRELHDVVAGDAMRSVISLEADRYLVEWTELAYAPSLPRLQVGLQRLVVVPRTMILARTLSGVSTRLLRCPAFPELDESFRNFLPRHILAEMDDAIRRSRPSPQRPVRAYESWSCVAIDRQFEWIDPMWSGPEWLGHVMLFEMPTAGLQRRQRKELEAAIERLISTLPNMSHRQRDGMIRTASAGLRPARV
jgi:hypothetical protein